MKPNYRSMILAIGLFLALFVLGGVNETFGIIGSREAAAAVAVQTDGKIVAAGTVTLAESRDFAVFRYNADGSLDASFDGDGKVTTDFDSRDDLAYAVAIQADGKIVAVGAAVVTNSRFALVRYNPDGSLDSSFGAGGKVTTDVGVYASAYAVAIQADGKIVAAGSGNLRFSIARYNPNGSLDSSFGTGGIISPTWGAAYSVALQIDGKIVVVGDHVVCDEKYCNYSFVLTRYNTDGSFDTSFGASGGIVWAYFGSNYQGARAVAVQPNGKIVAAGWSGSCDERLCYALARYNPDGSIDTTFDGDGKVNTDFGLSSFAYAVVLQSDGKIVAAGGASGNFALSRYNGDGSLDTSLDGDGKLTTDFGNFDEQALGVVVQADGRVVSAGGAHGSVPDSDFALARYNIDGSLDTSFDGDGKVTTSYLDAIARFDFDGDGRSDVSVFRPSDRVWYLNRSTNGFSATQFGLSTDKITPADYDGDGKTDISVYRDGTWYWLNSSDNSFSARQFGIASDIPVPANYYTSGRSDLAIYRDGSWWILNLSNNQMNTIQFGLATDKPLPADYDGDGRADQAIYRNGEWHLNRSTQGYTVVNFGLASDRPVVGDYDGDGRADPAVYRAGTWYILGSGQGFRAFEFGLPNDIPAAADYDGDGKTDAAVFRDGTWYINRSSGGTSIQQFGLPNDSPVPAAYTGF